MGALVVDVAFTPRLLDRSLGRPVVVLIDVLRATSTIATLFGLGATSVRVTGGLRAAQRLGRSGEAVCAELPTGAQAPHCELSVSPALLRRESVEGRDVVFCTTNGTLALHKTAPRAGRLLIGSLLNATAVAERAVALARELETALVVACAGRHGATIVSSDDVYAAGYILERARAAAERDGTEVALTDAAKIALAVCRADGPPERAMAESTTAAVLRRVGAEADVAFCARPDAMPIVPAVPAAPGESESHPVILL
jgi:2-phosphosulfolactate phosphatase